MNTDNDQNSTADDAGESYLELVNTMGGVDVDAPDANLNETSIPDGKGDRIELGEDGSGDDYYRQ